MERSISLGVSVNQQGHMKIAYCTVLDRNLAYRVAPAGDTHFSGGKGSIRQYDLSRPKDRSFQTGSKLSKKMAFQDWLREEGGPNVQVTWAVQYGATERVMPDCLETNAYMGNGRTIIVWVAVGHSKKPTPYVYRVGVFTGRDAATGKVQYEELDRLGDIPAFSNKLK